MTSGDEAGDSSARSRDLSSRAQKLADIPKEEFEKRLAAQETAKTRSIKKILHNEEKTSGESKLHHKSDQPPRGALDSDHVRLQRLLTKTQSELAKARARIAELEKGLAEAQQKNKSTLQRVSEFEQKWRKLTPHQRRVSDLQMKIRQLEALVLPLDDTQKDALRQYKRKVDREYKARWRQREAVIEQRTITMHSKDYALFIAGFHPDASKEMRDKARNRFVQLYERLVITDKDKVTWRPPA